MQALGYINLFWLHEFMNLAIETADDWYIREHLNGRREEESNYVLGFGERSDLFLEWFIQHGLLPAAHSLSPFQLDLVLDALATVIANDNPDLWQYVNYFEEFMGRDETLSHEPLQLFMVFFDILSKGRNYSLAEFKDIGDIECSSEDTLELYKYC